MQPLVWFRSDLRTADHPALWHACQLADGGANVAAVFVITPQQWDRHVCGAVKVDFLLRNVAVLLERLAQLKIPLHVLSVTTFKKTPAALLKLAQTLKCNALFFHREYGVNELDRDEAVTQLFEKNDIAVRVNDDQTIIPPEEVRTKDGRFYKVFTPFKRSWLDLVKQRLPLELHSQPKKRKAMTPATGEIPSMVEPFKQSPVPAALWPAGEGEAMRRLKAFVRHRIDDYHEHRDTPSLDGTSTLSPYLAAGVISPRQCLVAAMKANGGKLDAGSRGITTWISELVWREFYRHVLVGFPRICRNRAFRPETEKLAWRDDDKQFTAWSEGRTGVPIVDAAMRQLQATGWMHNRLRMITSMYLTKDLLIDWRRGERFFMRHLIDGDLASNNGGWQWSASTGTDAAPYFRIFNPVSQSRKCDPDGTFIRQYVPELADLGDKEIHDPSALPPLRRSAIDYPEPIVDHGEARKRTLKAFEAIK